jgi:hypothetical protein
MNSAVVLSVLVSLAINEFLGITDWLAYRMTRWAAVRWEERTGFDHLEEWLEDLEHSPGRLFKVISSAWLLFGTFVNVEHLTLNLPSLWRISRPFRSALREVLRAALGLLNALKIRASDGFFSRHESKLHAAVIRAAVSLLPRREKLRYSEEWGAELYEVPTRERTPWVIQLVLSAPRLAVWMRLRSTGS